MKNVIEKIEENEGVFSIMSVDGYFELEKFLKRKNLKLIKSISFYMGGKIDYSELLFKASPGFYLYLSKEGPYNNELPFNLVIYHKEEHLNEIQIFLKQTSK